MKKPYQNEHEHVHKRILIYCTLIFFRTFVSLSFIDKIFNDTVLKNQDHHKELAILHFFFSFTRFFHRVFLLKNNNNNGAYSLQCDGYPKE